VKWKNIQVVHYSGNSFKDQTGQYDSRVAFERQYSMISDEITFHLKSLSSNEKCPIDQSEMKSAEKERKKEKRKKKLIVRLPKAKLTAINSGVSTENNTNRWSTLVVYTSLLRRAYGDIPKPFQSMNPFWHIG